LIDAGQPAKALSHFWQAFRLSPAEAMRVWYKIAQAAGGIIGLGKLFLVFRWVRRWIKPQKGSLTADEDGIHWVVEQKDSGVVAGR
jgi:hypothetical protein